MKYALISCTNGNFKVESEYGDNLTAAKMAWHALCRTKENAADVISATIMVVDENFIPFEGFVEHITHPEPETEE
jgi:hypothetical protein